MNYTADHMGYRAQGTHLPVGPGYPGASQLNQMAAGAVDPIASDFAIDSALVDSNEMVGGVASPGSAAVPVKPVYPVDEEEVDEEEEEDDAIPIRPASSPIIIQLAEDPGTNNGAYESAPSGSVDLSAAVNDGSESAGTAATGSVDQAANANGPEAAGTGPSSSDGQTMSVGESESAPVDLGDQSTTQINEAASSDAEPSTTQSNSQATYTTTSSYSEDVLMAHNNGQDGSDSTPSYTDDQSTPGSAAVASESDSDDQSLTLQTPSNLQEISDSTPSYLDSAPILDSKPSSDDLSLTQNNDEIASSTPNSLDGPSLASSEAATSSDLKPSFSDDQFTATTLHALLAGEVDGLPEFVVQTESGMDKVTESAIIGDGSYPEVTTVATEDSSTDKFVIFDLPIESFPGELVTESVAVEQTTETASFAEESVAPLEGNFADDAIVESPQSGPTSSQFAGEPMIMIPDMETLNPMEDGQTPPFGVAGEMMQPDISEPPMPTMFQPSGQPATQSDMPTMEFILSSEPFLEQAVGGPFMQPILFGDSSEQPKPITSGHFTSESPSAQNKPCDHPPQVPAGEEIAIKGSPSRIIWIPHSVPHVVRYLPIRYYAHRPSGHYYVY